MTRQGIWANMCEEHFTLYGTGIGPGKGCLLVLADPGTAIPDGPAMFFVIGGQIAALLRKSGKSAEAYELVMQLFECKDYQSAIDLLSHYVHIHDNAVVFPSGETAVPAKTHDLMNC